MKRNDRDDDSNNSGAIGVGDNVSVLIQVWRDDELPSYRNYFTGKIAEIIERTKNIFYVRVEGLDRLVPIDRVVAA